MVRVVMWEADDEITSALRMLPMMTSSAVVTTSTVMSVCTRLSTTEWLDDFPWL
jgi:hypothetical protein